MENTVQYRVKKITFGRRQCRICGGSGKRNNRSGSDEKCLACLNGIETIEHQTEVSLKTALIELGIENLIRNTMAALQDEPKPKS